MGHNEYLGWAHTVNRPDIVDIFQLQINPENPLEYYIDEKLEAFEQRHVSIKVTFWGVFWWTFEREILTSKFGPAVKFSNGNVYAISYSGVHRSALQFLRQYLAMNKARNFEEFEKAHSLMALPLFNTVYADYQGTLYFHYGAKVPARNNQYVSSFLRTKVNKQNNC
jgi:acyl-homoserine-lactone acylase